MTGIQIDAPHFIVRASFGNATGAYILKDNRHLLILREFRKVASEDNKFAFVLP